MDVERDDAWEGCVLTAGGQDFQVIESVMVNCVMTDDDGPVAKNLGNLQQFLDDCDIKVGDRIVVIRPIHAQQNGYDGEDDS